MAEKTKRAEGAADVTAVEQDREADEGEAEAIEMASETGMTAGEEEVKYAFPTRSRCPRCKGLNTRAYKTVGKYQHRECQAPICRWRYVVTGQKV